MKSAPTRLFIHPWTSGSAFSVPSAIDLKSLKSPGHYRWLISGDSKLETMFQSLLGTPVTAHSGRTHEETNDSRKEASDGGTPK
jgi:hypothetical protein